jgi:hypothetical protein
LQALAVQGFFAAQGFFPAQGFFAAQGFFPAQGFFAAQAARDAIGAAMAEVATVPMPSMMGMTVVVSSRL